MLVTTIKMLQLLGDFVPLAPYWGSAPGPRLGTPVPQISFGFAPHPKPSAAFGM